MKFICSMLVRVPITFDAVVELLRESVVRNFPDDNGPIPDALVKLHQKNIGNKNYDKVELKDLVASNTLAINIDPHCCISSLGYISASIPIFQSGFSFGSPRILHNHTDLPFLSSDNPVCFCRMVLEMPIILFPTEFETKKHSALYFQLALKWR